MFHQFRREARCAQECAEAVLGLATAQGFTQWIAYGSILRGWALMPSGTSARRHHAAHRRLDSPACHRGRDPTTIFSDPPRRRHMGPSGSQKQVSRCSQKPYPLRTKLAHVGMSQSCIGSKATSCCTSLRTMPLKRRAAFITPLRSLTINKPSPSNYARSPVLLSFGSSKGGVRKPMTYSPLCITGSRRDLTHRTCKRLRCC
jgi:hypothetical protein